MSVYPSVCHTPVLCRNGEIYHQTFSSSGSHTILVFHTKRYGNIPKGASNAGAWKNRDFYQYLALYRKWYKIAYGYSYYGMRIEKPYPSFRMVPFWMTFSDPEWLSSSALQSSGSWLVWANGAAAHYVAIHCPRWRIFGPTVQVADTPSPQSATLGLHPVAVATTHFPSHWG